ncbi:MAG: hypothetical protein KDB63_02205 [Nocardioidaceae bacterium]|nr:hypothetical protein [Nocardioidaceae bacterium]
MSDNPSGHHELSDQDAVEPLSLAIWWRTLLAVSGAALLVTAGISVLAADNEIGTAAIALIGAVFLVVAALGQWPSRFTWGDKSAEFHRARRVRHAVASGADRSEVAEVAVEVARTPLERFLASQVQADASWWRVFEQAVLEKLERLGAEHGLLVVENADPARPWDARLITDPDQAPVESVLVVFDPAAPPGTGRTTRLVARVRRALGFADAPAVLVVTDADWSLSWQEDLRERLVHDGMQPTTLLFVTTLTDEDLAKNLESVTELLKEPGARPASFAGNRQAPKGREGARP